MEDQGAIRESSKQKWVFDLAKHGLNKKWDLRAIGLSFLRDQTVEREREEREREKKRRGRRRNQAKVWNLTLSMDFFYGILKFVCISMLLDGY